jgi:hypothetical protein
MASSNDKFENRAERFITGTSVNTSQEQTVEFISEIYRIENQLVELERDINKINPTLRSKKAKRISKDLERISEDIYLIQKCINSPNNYLHEILETSEEEVDELAVNEILTQLESEWFPRELDRLYSTQSRVFRKLGAKKQHILTNRIVVLSFIAVFLSIVGILSSSLN